LNQFHKKKNRPLLQEKEAAVPKSNQEGRKAGVVSFVFCLYILISEENVPDKNQFFLKFFYTFIAFGLNHLASSPLVGTKEGKTHVYKPSGTRTGPPPKQYRTYAQTFHLARGCNGPFGWGIQPHVQ